MYAAPTEIYTLSLHDALPICGGRTALLGDGAEIQVRGVEQLELVRGLVARGKDVGEGGAVLLHQAEQHVAPLLDHGEPPWIALDPRRIVPRRLRQLLHVRERPVQDPLPL